MFKPWILPSALIIAFLALGIITLLANQTEQGFSFEQSAFNNSQYLFPEQNKVSAAIDFNIVNSTVLQPAAPAFLVKGTVLGALSSINIEEKKEIEEYLVEAGDTLTSVAQKFNISVETILEANNLTLSSKLQPGQKLVILPVTGMMHVVREMDTVSEIAQIYSARSNDIIDFNDLGEEAKIYAGDFLIVPYAQKPKFVQHYVQVPLSQTYFICPIPSPCRVTQGLHWYNAIDFGNGKCGEPVYAAAGGTIQRTGYTSLGGYYVRILHPNGVVTYYGHLSKIGASAGQKVYQGQIIGYIGYSGKTIPAGPAGCHLHFDVRFAQNPFANLTVGDQLGK